MGSKFSVLDFINQKKGDPVNPRAIILRIVWIGLFISITPALMRFGRAFLVTAVVVGLLTIRFLKPWLVQVVPTAAPKLRLHRWLGLFMLISALVYLEIKYPAYFFRSDNKVQFFPVVQFGARAFFMGQFPTFNPYQFLGMPIIEPGLYALTYPLTYLSYWFAENILRNDTLFFDVFVIIHLILGYLIMERVLSRAFGIRDSLSSMSALTYALSGCFLIGGRDWFTVLPTLAMWTPLLFWGYIEWITKPTKMAAVIVGLTAGCFLHAGNVQMWFYLLCIVSVCGLLFIVAGGMKPAHWRTFPLGVLGLFAPSLPLLIPQFMFASHCVHMSGGEGILYWLSALLLPAPLVNATHPNNWGAYSPHPWTPFYFVGYLSVLLAISHVWNYRRSLFSRDCIVHLRSPHAQFIWLLGLVFVFSLGPGAPFWQLYLLVPKVNQLAQPFKLLVYLSFFVSVIASLNMEHWLRGKTGRHARLIEGGLYFLMVVGLLVHVPQALVSYDYFDDSKVPVIHSKVRSLINKHHRVASLYPIQPKSSQYFDALPFNIPTIYSVIHWGGMDALAEVYDDWLTLKRPDSYQAFGVRWVLVSKDRSEDGAQLQKSVKAKQIFSDSGLDIYEIPNPVPMLSVAGADVRYTAYGLDAHYLSPVAPQWVTLNFLWRPGLRVFADGHSVNVAKDSVGRITAELTVPTQNIQMIYRPSWQWGFLLVGFLTLSLSWLIWRVMKHR